jgi:WD40 repeat protein
MEADLTLAAARCPEGDARRRWLDLLRAVRDESHWLRDAPAELPSLLYNRLRTFGWTPEALAAIPGMTARPAWRLRHPLPAGRGGLARTITTKSLTDMGAFKSSAHSCAVTPDGTQILVGSRIGLITLWEVATGRALGMLRGHRYAVTSLVISPDGTFAVSASADRTLIVWDLATGLPRATLRGHRHAVWKCALVPGGARVVSASEDGTLKVWRLDGQGKPVTLRGHRGDVKDCAVTPDGRRVVSAGDDQTIRVWSLGGRPIGAPLEHRGEATCAVTPDGTSVLSLDERSAITFWDLASRRETAAVTEPGSKVLGCARVAGERPVILIFVSGSVWIRDLHTGDLYAQLPGDCDACSVFAGGRLAVTLSSNGVIKIWDIEDARRASAEVRTGSVDFCAATGDGRSVVSSSKTGLATWSTRTGGKELANQSGRLSGRDMTEDGRFVVCADYTPVAQLFHPARPATRAFEALAPAGDRVSAAAINADGRWLALGTEAGKVEVRPRASGGRPGLRSKLIHAHRCEVDVCRLSARGDRLVTGGRDGAVALWDLSGARAVRLMRRVMNPDSSGFGVGALALAADGRVLAFSSMSTDIEVWEASRAGSRRRHRLAGHTDYVNACALLPDGRLVSVSEDRTLKLWSLESGQCVQTLYGVAPFRSVAAADDLIAAGDTLGNLWLLESPRQKVKPPPIGPVRQRHAVLVGIDTYDDADLDALPNSANDVRGLAGALAKVGYRGITSLHDGARRPPTLDNVRRALRDQALHPDDLLLVHFSCHGTRIGGEPYLLMRDSKHPSDRQTALALAEVVELMEASRARRRVLLVDACAAGLALGAGGRPSASGGDPPRATSRRYTARRSAAARETDDERDRLVHVLAEGAVTLFASTSTQQALEAGDHGVFARSVIDALSGAARDRHGRVTVTSLILHVTASVRGSKDIPGQQDPTVDARMLGDFILAERRAGR